MTPLPLRPSSAALFLFVSLSGCLGPTAQTRCDEGCRTDQTCDLYTQLCVRTDEDTCVPGQTRSCASECAPTQTCGVNGKWGACVPGCGLEQCKGTQCICNPDNCSGCCTAEGRCLEGTTAASCGVAGNLCERCSDGRACSSGVCEGCNDTTCAGGCCSGNTCHPSGFKACGMGAAACVTCNPDRADACSKSGDCLCGVGPPCEMGQHCSGGACVCDASSCPGGCCVAGQCNTHVFPNCGAPESASCKSCDDRSDRCSTTGACSCGESGVACGTGQRCLQGSCVCDSTSCPTGCCKAGSCDSGTTLTSCGGGGKSCSACNGTMADACTAGGCRCGSGSACTSGQRCTGVKCVCDATSCPGGCCLGDRCMMPSLSECGSGGGLCLSCATGKADHCGTGCECGFGDACGSGRHCYGGHCL